MEIYQELVRLLGAGQKCALATIVQARGSIPGFAGAKMLVREDGSTLGTIGGGRVEAEVRQAAREVLETEQPRYLTFELDQQAAYENGMICGGQLSVYIEPVLPKPRAILFGAGHVSKMVSKVAHLAGFATVVVEDREAFANRERFPEALAIHVGPYEDSLARLQVDSHCYLIIATRSHEDDLKVLRWALSTPARYIAMIGSQRKVLTALEALEKEGIQAASCERIFAPMGLEIGAVTPEEIAVSVVAEMIAVRRRAESCWRELSKSVFVNQRFAQLRK